MSSSSGFFGTAGVNARSIGDSAYAATYTNRHDPKTNQFYDYLGVPNRLAPIDGYHHQPKTNSIGLDAYEGRNAFLSDTIEGFILADNEFYTQIIAPWVYTDEMNFRLNKIEFNRALPGPTPHEGTSRLLTMSKSSEEFTTQRYGIKFRMEGDFAATAQGQADYFRYLIQVSQSVQELANYRCELALLGCKNYYRQQSATNKPRGEEWHRVLINEVEDFACACTSAERLEKRIEEEREVFENDRIEPDLLLGPPGFKLFLSMEMMGQGARTGYETVGPQGQRIFNEGPRAAGILRGNLVVFESRSFNDGTGGPAVRPLERPTTIGECYPMSFGYRRGEVLGSNSARRFATSQRDVLIYDLHADTYKRVSFQKAFLFTFAFENASQGYGPDAEFKRMAVEQNKEAKNANFKEQHDEEFQFYRERASIMDAMGGEEKMQRRLPMMIAHNVKVGKQGYFVPTTLGQMDLDVINTSDFVQMAQSVYNREEEERNEVMKAIKDCSLKEDGESYNQYIESLKLEESKSPSSVLNLNSNAALIFGALPLVHATETTVYAPIDSQAGTLGEAPADNRLAAWVAKVNSEAAASGADDTAFKSKMDERRKVLHGVARAFGAAKEINVLKAREGIAKAIESNVTRQGDYKSGRSFTTLIKDLKSVEDGAASAAPAADRAASSTLHKYVVNDMAVNPQASHIVNELSAEQIAAIRPAYEAFARTNSEMEERLILHGNANLFDSRAPLVWVETVASQTAASDADLDKTRHVAEKFDGAHVKLHQAVQNTVLATASGAVDDTDRRMTYGEYLARMGSPVDAWTGTSSATSYDNGLNSFLSSASIPKSSQYTDGQSVFGEALNTGANEYRKGNFAMAKVPAHLKDIYKMLLDVPNNRRCWEMLMALNVHVPANVNLWRLWIRNRMQTVIMMRSGLETMGTTYGHANMVVSGEGATKTLEAHLTFQFGSIVWGPKGVRHLNNVLPRNHLGGWNCEFIESPSEIFDIAEEDRGSLIATIAPITENCYQWPLNFVPKQTYIDSARGSAAAYKDKVKLYGEHSSAAFYEKLWQLEDSVKFSEMYDTYSTQYKKPNTIAYQGNYFQYSPATGGMDVFRRGNGHVGGKKAGPGCRAVYQGKATMFPESPLVERHYG